MSLHDFAFGLLIGLIGGGGSGLLGVSSGGFLVALVVLFLGLPQHMAQGISLVGHLKPGVTLPQASSDLASVAAYLDKTYPKEDGKISFALSRPGLVGNMLGRPVRAFVS